MDYHLICVHPFGKYARGQMITADEEVAALSEDREHNFVRIEIPVADQVPEPEVPPEKRDPVADKALSDGQALIGKMAMDKQALATDPVAQPWPAPQPEPEKFASKKSTPT